MHSYYKTITMKLMKGLSIFALVGFMGLATTSCLNNDDQDFTQYGFFPTTSVDVNNDSIMPVGETTNIRVTFEKSNSCQQFVNFNNLDPNTGLVHKIGVYGSQNPGGDCAQQISYETKTLKFTPKTEGKYTLKFWAGTIPNTNTATYDSIVLDIKAK